jgi:elongation factor Ts
MANIDDVKRLRQLTQAGMLECRDALNEADGDFDRALELLTGRGHAKAAKLASREVGAERVAAYVPDGRLGALVRVGCNTDFVSRSDEFEKLAHAMAMHAVAMDAHTIEQLMASPWISDESITVEDKRAELAAAVGENIVVLELVRTGAAAEPDASRYQSMQITLLDASADAEWMYMWQGETQVFSGHALVSEQAPVLSTLGSVRVLEAALPEALDLSGLDLAQLIAELERQGISYELILW